MNQDHNTVGIGHSIHVADDLGDGELDNFREFENVLDVMNLPNGGVKFFFEGGEKLIQGGKIVRSQVHGLDEAARYRCTSCQTANSDLIGQQRGEIIQSECPVCEKLTEFEHREVEDI